MTPIALGQVRMDGKGKLGVITVITENYFVVQISAVSLQIVPLSDRKIFEETTYCLGDL